jgi:hypothetical protein
VDGRRRERRLGNAKKSVGALKRFAKSERKRNASVKRPRKPPRSKLKRRNGNKLARGKRRLEKRKHGSASSKNVSLVRRRRGRRRPKSAKLGKRPKRRKPIETRLYMTASSSSNGRRPNEIAPIERKPRKRKPSEKEPSEKGSY